MGTVQGVRIVDHGRNRVFAGPINGLVSQVLLVFEGGVEQLPIDRELFDILDVDLVRGEDLQNGGASYPLLR